MFKQENSKVEPSESKDELEENFGAFSDAKGHQSTEEEVTKDNLSLLETGKHSHQGKGVW